MLLFLIYVMGVVGLPLWVLRPGRGRSCVLRGGGSRRGIPESSFKNGVFLTVPVYRYFASVAELLDQRLASSALVRQATRGGRIPVLRGGKKHHRFFGWIREYPLRLPPPLRTQDRPLPGRNTHSGRRRRLWIKREREKYKKLKSGVLKAGGVSFIVGMIGIFLL